MHGNAAQDEQIRENVDDVHGLQSAVHPDRNAFARELIDDVQHPVLATIMRSIFNEVIRPDVVGMLGS